MLVTCPECGAKISSLANPCPNCGFPDAGYYSKERTEESAQEIMRIHNNEYKQKVRIEGCENCGFYGQAQSKIRVEVEKLEFRPGYETQSYCRCPKCGEETKKWCWQS